MGDGGTGRLGNEGTGELGDEELFHYLLPFTFYLITSLALIQQIAKKIRLWLNSARSSAGG
jgi:hypothetical protein